MAERRSPKPEVAGSSPAALLRKEAIHQMNREMRRLVEREERRQKQTQQRRRQAARPGVPPASLPSRSRASGNGWASSCVRSAPSFAGCSGPPWADDRLHLGDPHHHHWRYLDRLRLRRRAQGGHLAAPRAGGDAMTDAVDIIEETEVVEEEEPTTSPTTSRATGTSSTPIRATRTRSRQTSRPASGRCTWRIGSSRS